MIILITGASHTGKTLLAQRLLERCHWPYLSIDHLKMGLIRSGNTELTPADDERLTACLWPIVREIIKTAVENRQNLIVEGCYVPFDWRRDFDGRYLPSIRFLCLAMTELYIDGHFDEIRRHACVIESRLEDSDCTAEGLKADNRAVIDGFRQSGEPVFLIENDYTQTIRSLLEDPELSHLKNAEAEEGETRMEQEELAYCGVDCAVCPDYTSKTCPGCRQTAWPEDGACMPVACCRGKGISLCGACEAFPCAEMAEFYQESDSHREAYRRMAALRSKNG